MQQLRRPILLLGLLLSLVLPGLAACRGPSITPPTVTPPTVAQTTSPTGPATGNATSTAVSPVPSSTRQAAPTSAGGAPRPTAKGGRTVDLAGLPKEAQETMALIDRGGPFPYDRDGVTFQNREGLLPPQERGWYKEYTVRTPGSRDRGARRIIAGRDDRRWYTADHYESFQEIRR